MSDLGQIITFYSFKGGVGRTMALASTACLIARDLAAQQSETRIARVLAIDWDLEAPGLHRYFYPYFTAEAQENFDSTPGCLDLFMQLAEHHKSDSPNDFCGNRYKTCEHLSSIINFDKYLLKTTIPGLYIMKAGVFNDDYQKQVSQFNWERFFLSAHGLFSGFADFLKANFCYTLIDSRTGVTDTGGICTTLLPDKLVVAFAPNQQSFTGVMDMARKAIRYRRNSPDYRPIYIFPLPSRIEGACPQLAEDWRFGTHSSGAPIGVKLSDSTYGYQSLFETLYRDEYQVDQACLDEYFDSVVLQHIPDYSYGEPVVVEIESADSRISLRGSFQAFVERLVELDAPWMSLGEVRRNTRIRDMCDELKACVATGVAPDIIMRLCYNLIDADISNDVIDKISDAIIFALESFRLTNAIDNALFISIGDFISHAVNLLISNDSIDSSAALSFSSKATDISQDIGDYSTAININKIILDKAKSCYENNHPVVLNMIDRYASSLALSGYYNSAFLVRSQGIHISNSLFGKDHPESLRWNNLYSVRGTRKFNRVRVILLGPGAAGKTSLLRALYGEPVVEGIEDKTVGIEIREAVWNAEQNRYVPAPDYSPDTVVHFWDFGGQVMYHATHQFFLRSNCVYLVVLDGRRAAAGGSEADYWLEHVRAFAPEAPVLLVGNKADQGPMDWDQNRLRKKYPNIRPGGFYQLACTDPANPRYDFAKLKADLRECLEQVGMVQHKFTEAEFAVLAELRRRSPAETFLAKADYQGICDTHGLAVADGHDPRATLLDLLDKLGVVIHFPKIAELDDFLLNPRWLTYGVYQILERQQPRVTKRQVYQWLASAEVLDNLRNRLEYPQQRCGFLLEAMENFEVAYRLPHAAEATFVIPSLLPTDEPAELDFPEREAWAFRFRFDGLLPPQLLPRLIVTCHADIDGEKAWRHGVLLRSKSQGGARALLRGDAYDRTLTLLISGAGSEHLFSVLYDQVQEVLQTMPNLSCEALIRLPAAARSRGQVFDPHEGEPWARWVNVLHAVRNDQTIYAENGVNYDLDRVLGIKSTKDRQAWGQRAKTLHIHHHYRETTTMGDTIHISGGQVGAAGYQAKAEHNTLQRQINPAAQQANVAMATLVQELTQLFSAMKDAAAAPEHYEALAAVARAQDAAGKQDAPAALQHLQSAGRWALGIASEIGVSLAAEYLKQGL